MIPGTAATVVLWMSCSSRIEPRRVCFSAAATVFSVLRVFQSRVSTFQRICATFAFLACAATAALVSP